jgi:DNA-binding NtrC family response regulator
MAVSRGAMMPTAIELLGESAVMRQLRDQIARVARLEVPVLIEGEDGTGKKRVAQVIHDTSRRHDRPFVAVTCARLDPLVAASAFFGHRCGAFSGAATDRIGAFEAAHNGTLLLHHVDRVPLDVQGQLLRVVEDQLIRRLGETNGRALDVRVVSTTDRNLQASVRAGDFREDLFHRLRVVRLQLPPLESRREDIPLLANACLHEACRDFGRSIEAISRDAVWHLLARSWPSNVAQLRTTIEAAVLRSTGTVLEAEDLPPDYLPQTAQ